MKKYGIFISLIAVAAALLIASGASAAAKKPALQDTLNSLVDNYTRIHALLASDKAAGVQAEAKAIIAKADAASAAAGKNQRLKDSLAAVKKSAAALDVKDLKLDAARDAFGGLSDAVISLVQDNFPDKLCDKYYVFKCDMAKKEWLQKDEKIRNPYYGSEMPNCGKMMGKAIKGKNHGLKPQHHGEMCK